VSSHRSEAVSSNFREICLLPSTTLTPLASRSTIGEQRGGASTQLPRNLVVLFRYVLFVLAPVNTYQPHFST
jgi:hypothetical protein